MSLPLGGLLPKLEAVSPHHLGSLGGEDWRGALVLTTVMHLPIFKSPQSPSKAQPFLETSGLPPQGPTCQMTFPSYLGEMKRPFLSHRQSWLNMRNGELGALAAKVRRGHSVSQGV